MQITLHLGSPIVVIHEPCKDVLALPGGFIDAQCDRDTRAAALRVLHEKTGINAPYLEQLSTFSGPTREPRGWSISIVHYALVAYEVIENIDG
jgi:ADP-ribose pyrophosphatase YjhB (NUDIX family)